MRAALTLLLVTMSVLGGTAFAAESSNAAGYRDCDLEHLSACQHSNQLFFGPSGNTPKTDFSDALFSFLSNAPELTTFGHTFSAGQVASDSLVGPGDAPVYFPTGELLFDGFTPHAALNRGAVVFNPQGRIYLVATLSGPDTDESSLLAVATKQHVLRVYAHDSDPRPELVEYLRDWAQMKVDGYVAYPVLPEHVFVGTQLIIAIGEPPRWESRWLR